MAKPRVGPHLTLDNLLVCAFFLGLEDRMTLDLVEARVRSGASSPDPSIVIADILRGIGQGQLAASGMLARMGAIVRRQHPSQPPRPSAAVTAVRMWCRRPGRAVLAVALIAILAVQAPIAALAQTVPLLVGADEPGREILHPRACPMVGPQRVLDPTMCQS